MKQWKYFVEKCRDEAADICAIFASDVDWELSWADFDVFCSLGGSWFLALLAYDEAIQSGEDRDFSGWGEAEALLRTGWTP